MTYGSLAEERHPEGAGPLGDGHPDLAQPDDPERSAAELHALERAPRPFAAAHGGIGRGHAPREREQERQGVLGGGDRVAGRRVDDGDPGARGRVQVDVVDADAGPPDDLEPRAAAMSAASTATWLRTMSAS